ncbi:hypothetical protein QE152_g23128 [Popillia japonica]|uniref:Uncharacterized protein n=1 Tax=Popillia japonica TaxID=7064 RepID=A0AAW1KHR9_POPJA
MNLTTLQLQLEDAAKVLALLDEENPERYVAGRLHINQSTVRCVARRVKKLDSTQAEEDKVQEAAQQLELNVL